MLIRTLKWKYYVTVNARTLTSNTLMINKILITADTSHARTSGNNNIILNCASYECIDQRHKKWSIFWRDFITGKFLKIEYESEFVIVLFYVILCLKPEKYFKIEVICKGVIMSIFLTMTGFLLNLNNQNCVQTNKSCAYSSLKPKNDIDEIAESIFWTFTYNIKYNPNEKT